MCWFARARAASKKTGEVSLRWYPLRCSTRVESNRLTRHEAVVDFSAYLSILNPWIDKHPFALSRLSRLLPSTCSFSLRALKTFFVKSRGLGLDFGAVFGRLVFSSSKRVYDGLFASTWLTTRAEIWVSLLIAAAKVGNGFRGTFAQLWYEY